MKKFDVLKKTKAKKEFFFISPNSQSENEPEQILETDLEGVRVSHSIKVSELIKKLKSYPDKTTSIELAIRVLELWQRNKVLNPDDAVKWKTFKLSL
jgi:hypothetical protein